MGFRVIRGLDMHEVWSVFERGQHSAEDTGCRIYRV